MSIGFAHCSIPVPGTERSSAIIWWINARSLNTWKSSSYYPKACPLILWIVSFAQIDAALAGGRMGWVRWGREVKHLRLWPSLLPWNRLGPVTYFPTHRWAVFLQKMTKVSWSTTLSHMLPTQSCPDTPTLALKWPRKLPFSKWGDPAHFATGKHPQARIAHLK